MTNKKIGERIIRHFKLTKFALYKFLGKFIPYFKNKIMINNDRIRDLLLQKIKVILLGGNNNTLKVENININPSENNHHLCIELYLINQDDNRISINFNIDIVDNSLISHKINWSNYVMESDLTIHERFNAEVMYLAKELKNVTEIDKI